MVVRSIHTYRPSPPPLPLPTGATIRRRGILGDAKAAAEADAATAANRGSIYSPAELPGDDSVGVPDHEARVGGGPSAPHVAAEASPSVPTFTPRSPPLAPEVFIKSEPGLAPTSVAAV